MFLIGSCMKNINENKWIAKRIIAQIILIFQSSARLQTLFVRLPHRRPVPKLRQARRSNRIISRFERATADWFDIRDALPFFYRPPGL